MSCLNLSTSSTKQDVKDFNDQKNSNVSINMDLVDKNETCGKGQVKTEDKSVVCIEIENNNPRQNSNTAVADETTTVVEVGEYLDITERNDANLENQKPGRRKNVRSNDILKDMADPQSPNPPQYQPYPQQHTYPPYPGYPYPQNQQQPAGMMTRHLWQQGQQPPPPASMWPSPFGQDPAQYPGYNDPDHTPLHYDPQTRNKFVALVMGLVFVMLAITAGFLAVALTIPEVKEFFQFSGWGLIFLAMAGLLVVNYAMICSPCARRPPCNFFMLILATCCMSIVAAKISSHFRTELILYAVVATGAAVFVCVLLACSKFDFTSWMLYVVMISAGFSVIVLIVLLTMMFTGTLMKPILIVILVVGTAIQIVCAQMEMTSKKSIFEIVSNYHGHLETE